MNLSQLYYFRKLAQIQHYTEAAKQLYITQPALSNSIASLEQELEIALFEPDYHDKRRVKLTRYGKEFYTYVDKSLQFLDKGIELAHERAGSPCGELELGTIYTLQGSYLPGLMREYKNRFGKDTKFNVNQGLTIPLIEDLIGGRYEAVFCAFVPNKPELEFVEVGFQSFVAIMHKRNPLSKYTIITRKELLEAKNILTYPKNTPVGAEIEQILMNIGIDDYEGQFSDELTLASMYKVACMISGFHLIP